MLDDFHSLKIKIGRSVDLYIPVSHDSFVLYTDASGVGVGSALYIYRDEAELLVVFYSRQPQGSQRRYSAN